MFSSDKCNNSSAEEDGLYEGFQTHPADYQDMWRGIDEDMEYDGARRTQLTN